MHTLPDYHLDALFRAALEEEAEALASTAASESQMFERVGRFLARRRKRRQFAALLLAAALTTASVGAIALGVSRLTPPVTPEHNPQASSSPEASLPALRMPGASRRGGGFVGGEFGWTGLGPGTRTGMHSVVEDPTSPGGFRQTQLTFWVESDCFANEADAEPVPVNVAGLDGLYVEPYEDPAVQFAVNPQAGATTGAYALAVDDRTLCVYLTWDAASTQDELESARKVLASLRAQPIGPDGIRITFTLPEGWDTG